MAETLGPWTFPDHPGLIRSDRLGPSRIIRPRPVWIVWLLSRIIRDRLAAIIPDHPGQSLLILNKPPPEAPRVTIQPLSRWLLF